MRLHPGMAAHCHETVAELILGLADGDQVKPPGGDPARLDRQGRAGAAEPLRWIATKGAFAGLLRRALGLPAGLGGAKRQWAPRGVGLGGSNHVRLAEADPEGLGIMSDLAMIAGAGKGLNRTEASICKHRGTPSHSEPRRPSPIMAQTAEAAWKLPLVVAPRRSGRGGPGGFHPGAWPWPVGAFSRSAGRARWISAGIDGPAMVVQKSFGLDPFPGAAFVFRLKRADRITIGVRDQAGMVLVHKPVDWAAFVWRRVQDGAMRMASAQLAARLEVLGRRRVRPKRARIGKDISRRFDVVPARVPVLVTRRPRQACRRPSQTVPQAHPPSQGGDGCPALRQGADAGHSGQITSLDDPIGPNRSPQGSTGAVAALQPKGRAHAQERTKRRNRIEIMRGCLRDWRRTAPRPLPQGLPASNRHLLAVKLNGACPRPLGSGREVSRVLWCVWGGLSLRQEPLRLSQGPDIGRAPQI